MIFRICSLLMLASCLYAERAADGGGDGGGAGPNGPPVPGGDGGGQAAQGNPFNGIFMIVIIGVLVLMIFSSMRAQKKEKQRHEQLIDQLKIGDRVVTAGGVQGEVVRKGESDVDLKTGGEAGSVITFSTVAIKQVLGLPSGDAAADKQ